MRIITGKANNSVSNALGSGDCLDSASVRGRGCHKTYPQLDQFPVRQVWLVRVGSPRPVARPSINKVCTDGWKGVVLKKIK